VAVVVAAAVTLREHAAEALREHAAEALLEVDIPQGDMPGVGTPAVDMLGLE
jgi:hypothetical protein